MAAETKFVSYIPFLIWVDLVTRLHAFRFTRLHETKRCLRLRACRQVCKFIVWLSNCMVMARARMTGGLILAERILAEAPLAPMAAPSWGAKRQAQWPGAR